MPGTNCTVIGWGKSEDLESSEYEPAVNEVEVPVLNRELCNEWMIYRDLNVTDGMICAGFAEGGKDACQVGPVISPLFPSGLKKFFKFVSRVTAEALSFAPSTDTKTGGSSEGS